MTVHESAEDAVRAWQNVPEFLRRRMGTDSETMNLAVRMKLLEAAVGRYGLNPERRAEYLNARLDEGESDLSGPLTGIPMAEIVVRSDGGPWASHNQPCAVCGQRTAILDLNEGVMRPCWPCTERGWDLVCKRPRWWQKRYRSRTGVAE